MRSVLYRLLIVISVCCGCKDEPAQQPEAESVEGGTFWIDRWGQGRLDNQARFVDDALLQGLREYEGTRIALLHTRSQQEVVPGIPVVKEFKSVKSLPQPTGSVQLRWLKDAKGTADSRVRRIRNAEEVSFEVRVANNAPDDLILDKNELDLWITVRHPPEAYYSNQNSFGNLNGILSRT